MAKKQFKAESKRLLDLMIHLTESKRKNRLVKSGIMLAADGGFHIRG